MRIVRSLATLASCLALAACAGGKSYLRVTVDSVDPLDVRGLQVTLTQGAVTSLPFAVQGVTRIDGTTPVVFSVEIDDGRTGPVTVRATAQLTSGASAAAEGTGEIRAGEVTNVGVHFSAAGKPTDGGLDLAVLDGAVDAGTPDMVRADAAMAPPDLADAAIPAADLADAAKPSPDLVDAANAPDLLDAAVVMPADLSTRPPDLADGATAADLVMVAASCSDGIKNGMETDVDCGGLTCAPCSLGKTCVDNSDCASELCGGGLTCGGWEGVGPWGGYVLGLAVDPVDANTAYATTIGRIYRTRDGGTTWTRAATPAALLDDEKVWSIAVDPTNTMRIYARSERTMYLSVDGGRTYTDTGWSLGSMNPYYPPCTEVIIIPTAPKATVLVGSDDGVYATTDGVNFARAMRGLQIMSMAIDPADPKVVYVGTREAGIYQSKNSGGTFTAVTPPAPATIAKTMVSGLVVGPSSVVYAATADGVYRWDSLAVPAAAWTQEGGNAPTGSIASVAIDPANGQRVLAASHDGGVYRRSGGLWGPWSTGLDNSVDTLGVLAGPTGGQTIYATSSFGVYRTTSTSGVWREANHGISAWNVSAVAVDPQKPDTIYASTVPGWSAGPVFRSDDGAATWTPLTPPFSVTTLSMQVLNNTTVVHAGLVDTGAGYQPAYSSTATGGASWSTPVRLDPTGSGGIAAIAVDPGNPMVLYASNATGNGSGSGIYRSVDGGVNWTRHNLGLPTKGGGICEQSGLTFDAAGNLYSAGCGVWRLPRNGALWQAASGVSPTSIEASVHTLAFAASDGSLVAGSDNGVWYTTTPSAAAPVWNFTVSIQMGSLPSGAFAVAVSPVDAKTIWVGTLASILGTTTRGLGPRNPWLMQKRTAEVSRFAIRPGTPQTVYAGTSLGVFKTITGGQ